MDDVLLNKDLVSVILSKSNYDDIISYCSSHSYVKSICSSKYFWEEKAFNDFGYPIFLFRQTVLSPINKYKHVLISYNSVYKGAEKYIRWNKFVSRAIRSKRDDLIKYAKDNGYTEWYNHTKDYAYVGISVNANGFYTYIDALCGALEGKQYDLYNELKQSPLYNKLKNYDMIQLLAAIAFSGNIDMFDEMIEKQEIIMNGYSFPIISRAAISNNQKQMYEHLVELLDPINGKTDRGYGALFTALEHNNFDLFKYIFNLMDKTYIATTSFVVLIISKERMDLLDEIINNNDFIPGWNWTHLVCESIKTFNPNVYNHVIKLVPDDYDWLYDFDAEGTRDDPEYERFSGFNWMYILYDLIDDSMFEPEIIDYVINYLAPKDYDWDIESLIVGVKYRHPEYVDAVKMILKIE